ncbi:hypothetical protein CF335_g7623 [Tilletia laevis]|nr:hypothetical protein CF335_g7623 [Tilletia laevis]
MAHRYRARPHGRHYRRCAITGKLRERLVLKLSVALRGGTRGYCYGVHGSTSPPSSDQQPPTSSRRGICFRRPKHPLRPSVDPQHGVASALRVTVPSYCAKPSSAGFGVHSAASHLHQLDHNGSSRSGS